MPAVDFTFSGESKRIIITSGVTSVDVQDMYARWKDWTLVSDNIKYVQAFRTFGGDPTIAGQFAPRYFFLTNNWRVEVNYGDINFGVNLYTDELEPPVIVTSGATASIFNSDAVNVENEVSQGLDYAGMIQINVSTGVSGTTYPVGTNFSPVNNIQDALTIATTRNIHELHIFGPVTFDANFPNAFEIYGGNVRDEIYVQNVDLSGSTFRQCVISGTVIGNTAYDNCVFQNGIVIDSATMQHCGFNGNIYINDDSNITMVDCFSQVPGNQSPSIFLGNDINLSMRRYSGGMKFYDCNTGTTVTIEYTAGNCQILSGCTGGEIEVRGIAKFTDQSSGTTIGTLGLLIPSNVASQHSINVQTEMIKNNNNS